MEREHTDGLGFIAFIALAIAGAIVLWKGGPTFYLVCTEKAAAFLEELDPYGRDSVGPRFNPR